MSKMTALHQANESRYNVRNDGIVLRRKAQLSCVAESFFANSRDEFMLYGPPLQEGYIRLIRLLPADKMLAPIECTLFEIPLDNAPKWEALSYMWGNVEKEAPLFINDIKISIRKNLSTALCHLRGPKERVLWIDALSINQKSVEERNSQVKQMKRIYESSSRVIIWLGPSFDDSAMALGFITEVGRYPNVLSYCGHGSHKVPYKNGKGQGSLRPKHVGRPYWDNHDNEVQAVRKLLERPYWHRLWIIQEVIVASKARIQCGSSYTTWEHLTTFKEALENFLIRVESGLMFCYLRDAMAFKLARTRQQLQHRPVKLEDLMRRFANSQCSDIRDKVYGLVGLADDATDLVIDYSKTLFDLFVDVVLLERSTHNEISRRRMISFAQSLQIALGGSVCTPSIGSPYSLKAYVQVVGYRVGTIKLVGPSISELRNDLTSEVPNPLWSAISSKTGYNVKQFATSINRNFHDLSKVASISSSVVRGTKEGEEHAPATTLDDESTPLSSVSQIPEKSTTQSSPTTELQPTATEPTNAEPTITEPTTSEPTLSEPDTSATTITDASDPKIVVTQNGHIYISPSDTLMWDVVCRFYNSDVIAILRWVDDHYTLIGRAVFSEEGNGDDGFLKVDYTKLAGAAVTLSLDLRSLQLLSK